MKTDVHLWLHLVQFFLQWEMFQTKIVEKIKTRILWVMIMWKNTAEQGRSQITIWRMRIVCWIAKAKNTHSEYVVLIALPQQWMHKDTSILCYTYINCLMSIKIQPDATICRYLFTAKSLYMFRVSQHPSSGVLKTVTAASGAGTATSLQRGLIRPRWREVAVPILWPVPEVEVTVFSTPDDGCCDTRNM